MNNNNKISPEISPKRVQNESETSPKWVRNELNKFDQTQEERTEWNERDGERSVGFKFNMFSGHCLAVAGEETSNGNI